MSEPILLHSDPAQSVVQPRPPFDSSHTKIKRAKQHIAALSRRFTAYEKSSPFTVEVTITSEAHPTAALWWTELDPLCCAILGDAIHNLRTALDTMAAELARRNDKSDKGVHFPFAGSAAGLEEQITAKKFDRAGDDAVKLLRQFAPYKGGNERLRALHDLDIEDKHCGLLIASRHYDITFTVPPGLPVGATYKVGNMKAKTEFQFHHDLPLAREPVIKTLKELVKLTEGIVEAFASLVASRA